MPNASTRRLCNKRGNAHGFTLIEVLVVVAISAILLAIGIPSFNATVSRAQARDAAQTLHASLQLARSEAIRRAVPVTVCRTTNPGAVVAALACDNSAVAGFPAGDWASGWIIFAEQPAVGTIGVIDAGDAVIRVQDRLGAGGRRAELLAGGGGAVTFTPLGVLQGGAELQFVANVPQAALGAPQFTQNVMVRLAGQITVTGL